MKTGMFKSLVIFCLFGWSLQGVADGDRPLSVHVISHAEVSLSDSQRQALHQDGPFADVVIDDENTAWIAGRTYLWRWSLPHKTLTKIGLGLSDTEMLRKLLVQQNEVYAFTDKAAIHVIFSPRKLQRIAHPNYAEGRTLDAVLVDGGLWWAHSDGIVHFADGMANKPGLLHSNRLKSTKVARFDASNRQLWSIEGGRVIVSDFKSPVPKDQIVHQASEAFLNIQLLSGEVFASTNFTVLRFNATQRNLLQVIPVEEEHKLLSMQLGINLHTYLFNDALYEAFDLNSQTHYQTRFKLPSNNKITGIRHGNGYAMVLLEDRILAFAMLAQSKNVAKPAQRATYRKL